MDIKKEIWALQLIQYFLTNRKYMQVRFVQPGAGPSNDIWLVSPENTYTVIHITTENASTANNYHDTIKRQADAVMNVINKRGNVLVICLDEGNFNNTFENITIISLHPGASIPANIADTFPELSTVVYDTDDPASEKLKLEKTINDYAAENNNERKRNARLFKASISKTSLVAGGICLLIWAFINIAIFFFKQDATVMGIVSGAYYKGFINYFHDWWRLLTSGFVHIDFLHFICNMMALVSISKVVEDNYGFVKTMILMIGGIVFGNLLVYVCEKNIVAVGISGGIYALFGAMTVIYWQQGFFSVPLFRRRFMTTVYMNLLISFLPNVSLWAHLGGLAAGFFIAAIYSTSFAKNVRISFAICLTALVIGCGFMAYQNRQLNVIYTGTDMEVVKFYVNIGQDKIAEKIAKTCLEYAETH